ncbi:MAG: zinc ribbon domain-containing protein [Deltaproteobacteria bacterium]|nr:zinc ribbon domain-containing protein [Deltaproteobacteria bacterium]
MSERDLGSYEMLWDCQGCDTKKLLGKTHRFCPNCGAAQDPARRYFPSDAEKIAVKDHVFFGADVMCRACGVPNSRNAKHCVACGADLGNAKDAVTRDDQVKASGGTFAGETSKDAKREREQKKAAASGQAPPAKTTSGGIRFFPHGVIALVVLFIAFIIVALVWKKEAAITVTGHTWQRTIDIEKFGPKRDSAWCDSMPGDAYRVSKSREVRSHRKVADGETCSTRRKDQGDGTFKEVEECRTKYRDEPVYDDKCSYTVDRWQRDRTVSADGATLAETPAWPAVRLSRTGSCMGCEREGPRHEKYELHVKTDEEGKTSSCGFDQNKWSGIADGSRWKMKFAVITGLPDCDSMIAP